MTTIGCGRGIEADEREQARQPIVADDSLTHAFDTRLELRLADRLELDNLLRDRDIQLDVADGVISITGEVWTMLEKQRVSDVVRRVAVGFDVANHLDIRPPD